MNRYQVCLVGLALGLLLLLGFLLAHGGSFSAVVASAAGVIAAINVSIVADDRPHPTQRFREHRRRAAEWARIAIGVTICATFLELATRYPEHAKLWHVVAAGGALATVFLLGTTVKKRLSSN